ncbi:MAG: hypothetical protein ACYTFY_10415 [Planctomycetota bacterium]|jgi:hypothetical protein
MDAGVIMKLAFAVVAICVGGVVYSAEMTGNLLLNPTFEFHSFESHRNGKPNAFYSNNTAFWNYETWGDITVMRESHVKEDVRPDFSVANMVKIEPGKKLWQFITLPEAGLAHGEKVSLSAFGYQKKKNALVGRITLLKLDSEDGTWKPGDFGLSDKRTFPKQSRGELIPFKKYEKKSAKAGRFELKIKAAEIIGNFHEDREKSYTEDRNTIALQVEFENISDREVWVAAPILSRGENAGTEIQSARTAVPYYRHIPRTMQKLWKGEPLHILVMGSSIDRGSANPPMYPYNEDQTSKGFKKPLSDRDLDTKLVGRPELNDYYAWSNHYFSYSGRLRRELMRKFNLPVNKVLFNIMACDGSCAGEAHSGLEEYCNLSLAPDPNLNGHKSGKSWKELYPELFTRPEGPRPDLVIFGSGANEKTDTPDEIAVFEGMIRWIQMHYPDTEFIGCQFQNRGAYTPNPSDMMAISLRYQIPFLDYGKLGDDVTRWCNPTALVPRDGHPQAASHFLWFKVLERAFEAWDPILPGQAQRQLPERIHKNTYGWEGEMVTYKSKDKRIKDGNKFILDDTAFNCWGKVDESEVKKGAKPKPVRPVVLVDGEKHHGRRSMPGRDIRNSLMRHGRLSLGDRHVIELAGPGAELTFVDSKVCPNRRLYTVAGRLWNLNRSRAGKFRSSWGAPYGTDVVTIKPGRSVSIDVAATDLSVAYVNEKGGGTLVVEVDGENKLEQKANVVYVDADKKEHYMEDRKGIRGLPFGIHAVKITAKGKPVKLLGIFGYDSRANLKNERRLTGIAAGGDTINFIPAFKARPLVICSDNLQPAVGKVTKESITFKGGKGTYQIIGE